ncbi:MAG: BON domain-containing protein [Alteromonadaceae bacterium]|nr:BON domain-containing protein [Alteromonadaceae bacterium]
MKLLKAAAITSMLAGISLLQGCIAAAVVTIVGGATVANDQRSLGNQIDDQKIEIVAHNELAKEQNLVDNTNLQVVSVNGSVLIVGQAPNTYLRDHAIKTLNKVSGIVQIHNQIRIGNIVSIATRTNDIWLTSKVKAALIAKDGLLNKGGLDSSNVKVITENGEVFLMGLMTKTDANIAVDIARNVGGVNRVFKIFEYQD